MSAELSVASMWFDAKAAATTAGWMGAPEGSLTVPLIQPCTAGGLLTTTRNRSDVADNVPSLVITVMLYRPGAA